MRTAVIDRKTNETDIHLELNLDGKGVSNIDTGCGFLNHMLTLFAKHGRFDLTVKCVGDIDVDAHHTTEDCGIVLGTAFRKALSDMKGINRYGSMLLPMDETLMEVALDISGRGMYLGNLSFPSCKVGDFDTELTNEFFIAFTRTMGLTLHLVQIRGENSHHIIEAAFKGVGRALKNAVKIDEEFKNEIPSTKGLL